MTIYDYAADEVIIQYTYIMFNTYYVMLNIKFNINYYFEVLKFCGKINLYEKRLYYT